MNYPTIILDNRQGLWQDQLGYWPFEKSKEELKEERIRLSREALEREASI